MTSHARRCASTLLLAAFAALPTACADPGVAGDGVTSEPTSEVTVALTSVPGGVSCVRITGTVGSQSVAPPLVSVVPGTPSATLSLGRLPWARRR